MGREFTEEDFRRTFGLRNESILPAILGPLSDVEMANLALRARVAGKAQDIVTSTPKRT